MNEQGSGCKDGKRNPVWRCDVVQFVDGFVEHQIHHS